MNKLQLFKKLEKERKKLNKLIDKALEKGIPVFQTQEIIEQSRKVNVLVEVLQNEMNKINSRSGKTIP